MESLNLMKDYAKDEEIGGQRSDSSYLQLRRQALAKRMVLYLVASAVLIVTLLLILTVGVLVRQSLSHVGSSARASEALKTICNVTLYSNLCVSSLSSRIASANSDPESILKLSLRVSGEELHNMTALVNSMTARSSSPLSDCAELLGDALKRVNDSFNEMEDGDGVLNPRKVGDIRTWVSAAVTNQDTCLDGLRESPASGEDEAAMRGRIELCRKLLSNSLAIVSHVDELLAKFNLKMY